MAKNGSMVTFTNEFMILVFMMWNDPGTRPLCELFMSDTNELLGGILSLSKKENAGQQLNGKGWIYGFAYK
ncbi:MAG: hypothetical protein U5R06_02245 [candidate division KSB1 bacterium]|nr:hypothetical protein [candidate division KSB1 bacterium]